MEALGKAAGRRMFVEFDSARYVRLRGLVGLLLAVLLVMTAMLLSHRRLAGALREPLGPLSMAGVTLVLVAWAAAVHGCLRQRDAVSPALSVRMARVIHLAVPLALLVVVLALAVPGTGPLAIMLLIGGLGLEELLAWRLCRNGPSPLADGDARFPAPWREARESPRVGEPGLETTSHTKDHPARSAMDTTGAGPMEVGHVEIAGIQASDTDTAEFDAADFVASGFDATHVDTGSVDTGNVHADGVTLGQPIDQQLVRFTAQDGSDWIQGRARAHFSTGQRISHIHVAFCPPLETTPAVEIEPPARDDLRVELGQSLPYGMRLDLRLTRPAQQDESFLVEFSANTSPDGEDP